MVNAIRILAKPDKLYADKFLGKLMCFHVVDNNLDCRSYIVVGLVLAISEDVEADPVFCFGRSSPLVPWTWRFGRSAEVVLVLMKN